METTTAQHPNQTKTQREKILALLAKARGQWIPLPQLMACAAQYNSRIFELRRLGFDIENKTETIDGERHSWFRLAPPFEVTTEPVSGPDRFTQHHRADLQREVPLFADQVRP